MTEEQEKRWLGLGYDQTTLAHRKLLLEKISKYGPIESILDVGCGHGPDLALIEMAFPDAKLYGIDPLSQDIDYARRHLVHSKVFDAKMQDIIPLLAHKQFDVVFTNGVMMYNEKQWILELKRLAKKAVILSERTPGEHYTLFLREHGIEPVVTKITEEIRPTWREDGFIYEIVV